MLVYILPSLESKQSETASLAMFKGKKNQKKKSILNLWTMNSIYSLVHFSVAWRSNQSVACAVISHRNRWKRTVAEEKLGKFVSCQHRLLQINWKKTRGARPQGWEIIYGYSMLGESVSAVMSCINLSLVFWRIHISVVVCLSLAGTLWYKNLTVNSTSKLVLVRKSDSLR